MASSPLSVISLQPERSREVKFRSLARANRLRFLMRYTLDRLRAVRLGKMAGKRNTDTSVSLWQEERSRLRSCSRGGMDLVRGAEARGGGEEGEEGKAVDASVTPATLSATNLAAVSSGAVGRSGG